MGWTVLYILFGIVALWLLGEVLLQYKARLRWRILAFSGFSCVVLGVVVSSVPVIGAGIAAFAVGQTFVTLSYRRGFSTGWALGGVPGTSRRRRETAAPAESPSLEISDLEAHSPTDPRPAGGPPPPPPPGTPVDGAFPAGDASNGDYRDGYPAPPEYAQDEYGFPYGGAHPEQPAFAEQPYAEPQFASAEYGTDGQGQFAPGPYPAYSDHPVAPDYPGHPGDPGYAEYPPYSPYPEQPAFDTVGFPSGGYASPVGLQAPGQAEFGAGPEPEPVEQAYRPEPMPDDTDQYGVYDRDRHESEQRVGGVYGGYDQRDIFGGQPDQHGYPYPPEEPLAPGYAPEPDPYGYDSGQFATGPWAQAPPYDAGVGGAGAYPGADQGGYDPYAPYDPYDSYGGGVSFDPQGTIPPGPPPYPGGPSTDGYGAPYDPYDQQPPYASEYPGQQGFPQAPPGPWVPQQREAGDPPPDPYAPYDDGYGTDGYGVPYQQYPPHQQYPPYQQFQNGGGYYDDRGY